MPLLSSQVIRRVLDTASTLAALDGDALDEGLPVLGTLLGADLVTYHRFDLVTRTEESVVCPEEVLHQARRWPDYRAHLGQDPLLRHYAATGDAGARRLSDVAETAVFHRSEVYQHYYRVAGLRHQLALPVRGLPGQLIGFTLCRASGRDFSVRDGEALSLLGPHLARLHRQCLGAAGAGTRPAAAAGRTEPEPPQQRPDRPVPLTQREREVLELSRRARPAAGSPASWASATARSTSTWRTRTASSA